MWRALAFLSAFCALLAFQFAVYPGHSYLAGDSLLFVPILRHLEQPGLLSRDLLAVHPNVTYTIYDEATLFLTHVAHIGLQQALLGQLLVFRAAALAGAYLLSRLLGLHRWASLAAAACANCGAYLPGLQMHLIDREPVPSAFAFGAILLAAGLFAHRRPIAGGIAAGVALLYDATFAVPFLLALGVVALFQPRWRRMLRSSVAVLFAFALLLANLAQLQPGVPEAARVADRIPPPIEAIQRMAVPQLWISQWSGPAILWYAAAALFFAVIFRTMRPNVRQPASALFLAMPLLALAAVLFSLVLLDFVHWHEIPVLQPARQLLLFVAVSSVLFWSACFSLWKQQSSWAKAALLFVACACPATEIASRFPLRREPAMKPIATWAEENTWGGAMFLFPDAAAAAYPSVFRAESKRAVWVDWASRAQSAYFDSFADEWYRRWQDTMGGEYSPVTLERFLALPIDYYVLRRTHGVAGVNPVFADRDFVVYDAHDLRAHNGCKGCLY